MIKTIDCSKSSHISVITYNDETEELKVEYQNGEVYTYFGVPAEVAEEVEKADSKGRILNQVIYCFYSYKRL